MKGSIQRRLTVAINWSAARIASLDSRERYEDSYALTEEFREWILGVEHDPELMMQEVLMAPNFKDVPQEGLNNGSDGLLEI